LAVPVLFAIHSDAVACFAVPLLGMTLTAVELDRLADAIAERLATLTGKAGGDEIGDVHDAARWLKCSVPSVERAVRDEQIPSFKVGRLRRFRRADLLGMSSATQGGLK
jgi:excisionase family DNA binding protein